ncbi:MAG TPA: hypothetical protein DEO39_02300 [Clostridiales bacterium]|nr:hypothetical protein [Clostridiales bacterium]
MLGDELKKALEPIQASDELLEKTRRAIEQARVQQAQQTLDKAIRKDARRSLFLKSMVPVAGVLLIVGVLAVVLHPTLSNKKEATREIKEHNDAINTVTAEIDSILGLHSDNKSSVKESERDGWDFEYETTRQTSVSTVDSEDVAEDTTAEATEASSGDPEDMSRFFSTTASVRAGDHFISVSGDRSGIVVDWNDQKPVTPKFKSGNSYLGADKSKDNETDKITGLFYDTDTDTLYITVSHYEDGSLIATKRYLYSIGFENGELSESGPELVCMIDN